MSALFLAGGCAQEEPRAEAPEMSQAAWFVQTCLRAGEGLSSPCVADALDYCEPVAVSRDACLDEAIAQAAAIEDYWLEAPEDPTERGAPLALLVGVGVATLGFFGALGWRIVSSTRRRNQAAFDLVADQLTTAGFDPVTVTDFPGYLVVPGHRPARGLVSRSDPTTWLLEFERVAALAERSWPRRFVIIESNDGLPAGSLAMQRSRSGSDGRVLHDTFPTTGAVRAIINRVQALLGTIDGKVTFASEPHGFVLATSAEQRPVRSRGITEPASLTDLLTIARSIDAEVTQMPDQGSDVP